LNFNTTIVGKTAEDSASDLRASRASFFKSVTNDKIRRFVDILKSRGIPTLYRKSLATDIGAGCGQLGFSANNIKPTTI
jgi:adenine C2-methylase RlmN of 23S rRNA A2503 and tRNA A37